MVMAMPRFGSTRMEDPDHPDDAAGSGSYALVRRPVYEAAGGHVPLRREIIDDIELGKLLKRNGARILIRVAPELVRVRMYRGNREAFWVMAKNMPLPLLIIALPLHALALVLLTLRAAFRRRGLGEIRAMWCGVLHALLGLGPMLCKRRDIQRSATVSWLTIARAMTWSPWRYLTRRADLRPPD